jgi:hypothetical protein
MDAHCEEIARVSYTNFGLSLYVSALCHVTCHMVAVDYIADSYNTVSSSLAS